MNKKFFKISKFYKKKKFFFRDLIKLKCLNGKFMTTTGTIIQGG